MRVCVCVCALGVCGVGSAFASIHDLSGFSSKVFPILETEVGSFGPNALGSYVPQGLILRCTLRKSLG